MVLSDKRYQQNGREGLKERSRAPGRVHNRTEASVETAVMRVRKTILSGVTLNYAMRVWVRIPSPSD